MTSTAPRPAVTSDDLGTYENVAERLREAVSPHLRTPSARTLSRWGFEGLISIYRSGKHNCISFSEVLAYLEPHRVNAGERP